MPTLNRLPAPAFWSRWEVLDCGQVVGTVEKRGQSSLWSARCAPWGAWPSGSCSGFFNGMIRTRTEAVRSLMDHVCNGHPSGGA